MDNDQKRAKKITVDIETCQLCPASLSVSLSFFLFFYSNTSISFHIFSVLYLQTRQEIFLKSLFDIIAEDIRCNKEFFYFS